MDVDLLAKVPLLFCKLLAPLQSYPFSSNIAGPLNRPFRSTLVPEVRSHVQFLLMDCG
jgi:hypothetical protein